jgi:hypothetical protein
VQRALTAPAHNHGSGKIRSKVSINALSWTSHADGMELRRGLFSAFGRSISFRRPSLRSSARSFASFLVPAGSTAAPWHWPTSESSRRAITASGSVPPDAGHAFAGLPRASALSLPDVAVMMRPFPDLPLVSR